MRIGIDIRTLMDAQYSGVPEYTYNLVTEILKLDKKNEYRLFYNSARDISDRMPKFEAPNVEVIKRRYPNKILNYLLFKVFNRPKVDKLLGVDLFLMPHMNFIALSGAAKSILIIHDLSFLRYPQFFSARKNFWHKMINVPKLVKKFDKIATISENTKNDIVELCGVSPEKVRVIYSGIGKEFKKIENKKSDEMLSIKKKHDLPDKFILFLGTIEPRKNIAGLILAYNELRSVNRGLEDHQLIIAGGAGWKGDDIFKTWKNSPYKDDIKFLGYIGREEKVCLYNLASLFVYPSFYEGFGFPPLEAMACGTPVIASFSSSLPEILGTAALLVDPYDCKDMAMAIERILKSDELRNNFIERGLDKAREFSWEKTAGEYLKTYEL